MLGSANLVGGPGRVLLGQPVVVLLLLALLDPPLDPAQTGQRSQYSLNSLVVSSRSRTSGATVPIVRTIGSTSSRIARTSSGRVSTNWTTASTSAGLVVWASRSSIGCRLRSDGSAPSSNPSARPTSSPACCINGSGQLHQRAAAGNQRPGLLGQRLGLVQHLAGADNQGLGPGEHRVGALQQRSGGVEHAAGAVEQRAGPAHQGACLVDQLLGVLQHLLGLSDHGAGRTLGLVRSRPSSC